MTRTCACDVTGSVTVSWNADHIAERLSDGCDYCHLCLQMEKQTALLENEKQKMEDLQTAHQQALDTWQQTIGPRQQVIIT